MPPPSPPTRYAAGTRLRYPIYDARGVLVLKADTLLNAHLVSLLARRGLRVRLSAALEVVAGGSAGARVDILDEPVRIGRHPDCQVRPNSSSVSARHCVIDRLPLSFWIRDLKSTNGTFVNGLRLDRPRELHDGDVVQFGDYGMRVAIWGALESEGGEASEVARIILADRAGDATPPGLEKTLVTDGPAHDDLLEEIERRGL